LQVQIYQLTLNYKVLLTKATKELNKT